MIAMRRVMFRGWGLEVGLRMRFMRPEFTRLVRTSPDVQRVARRRDSMRDADQRRAHWERIWIEQGGR